MHHSMKYLSLRIHLLGLLPINSTLILSKQVKVRICNLSLSLDEGLNSLQEIKECSTHLTLTSMVEAAAVDLNSTCQLMQAQLLQKREVSLTTNTTRTWTTTPRKAWSLTIQVQLWLWVLIKARAWWLWGRRISNKTPHHKILLPRLILIMEWDRSWET